MADQDDVVSEEPRHTAAQMRAELDDDERAEMERDLAEILLEVEKYDQQTPPDYESREGALVMAHAMAWMLGYRSGYRCAAAACCDTEKPFDPADIGWAGDAQEWPVLYIDLPSGQVSWHMPAYPGRWDQHTTQEKYDRIRGWHETLHDGPQAG